MKRIGLLSDTHGYWDERILQYFSECDEVWHAGDWGSSEIKEKLEAFKPLRGVWGNIDGYEIRKHFPQHNRFTLEGVRVWITHIGGYPGKYEASLRALIQQDPPDLFITGHSHILKIMYDKRLKILHINPGAAGKQGFHQIKTMVRFILNAGKIEDVEVIELYDTRETL